MENQSAKFVEMKNYGLGGTGALGYHSSFREISPIKSAIHELSPRQVESPNRRNKA